MKRAGPGLRFIVVGERVLLPFAIDRISVESDIGMNRHPIVGQHATMYSASDFYGDRLKGHRIDEE